MKKWILMCAALAAATMIAAADGGIKGTMNIVFNTRAQQDDNGKPLPGVKDVYTLDINAVDTLSLRGTVDHQPGIYDSVLGMEKQPDIVHFALDAAIRNPADLKQEKTIGRLVGSVPVDKKGVYQFGEGNMRFAIDSAGKASGFESMFTGRAVGKPPKTGSLLEKAKQQAVTLTRQVGGKTAKLTVTNFDRMVFQDLVMAAGPLKSYPEVHANGEMLYDYERSAWYFNGVTLEYLVDGKPVKDKISGNIKWVESPNYKTTGEGKYAFDVRVNEAEPGTGEQAVFAGADDEAAFFAVDNTIPGLGGEARYKDTLSGDDVRASAVTIDLNGNKLTKQQTVALFKLIWLVSIVPMNSD